MKKSLDYSIIELQHFIQATRDSGYKGTASAIAELIDNAFEANATCVDIHLLESNNSAKHQLTVIVSDNGNGMSPSVLQLALRFGGSTRFNSRKGTGRYGMGLPNSSLSRARRVDVYSWTKPNVTWWSYLDVDEIASGLITCVPKPKRVKLDWTHESVNSKSGTIIVWSNCDRLDYKTGKKLTTKLHHTLGKIFRRQLWKGKSLKINGKSVRAFDPLFQHKGANLVGATPYGPQLRYEIVIPGQNRLLQTSTVFVSFTELPIDKWHNYSNEEKRAFGISKNAGVSIVRSGREIDYGWFFMGTKRKENYDDWWRCEIQFNPELDELFGVTNTKQGIHPTEHIKSILTPDLERVAHMLNSRVRKKYFQVKSESTYSAGQNQAESRDHLLEPPAQVFNPAHDFSLYGVSHSHRINKSKKNIVTGLAYRIEHKVLPDESFFIPLISAHELVVLLNEEHPFYERVYAPIAHSSSADVRRLYKYLELLLFSAARAECSLTGEDKQIHARCIREVWSKTLAAFLD
jgi:hypothetical protein